MSAARNVGGVKARSGFKRRLRRPHDHYRATEHYLTESESDVILKSHREKQEAKGIFRRWNGRKLTPEQHALASEALQRQTSSAKRKARRAKKL